MTTPRKTATTTKQVFTKSALTKSAGFSIIERDILMTVLKDEQQYTLDEAKSLIKKFKGGI